MSNEKNFTKKLIIFATYGWHCWIWIKIWFSNVTSRFHTVTVQKRLPLEFILPSPVHTNLKYMQVPKTPTATLSSSSTAISQVPRPLPQPCPTMAFVGPATARATSTQSRTSLFGEYLLLHRRHHLCARTPSRQRMTPTTSRAISRNLGPRAKTKMGLKILTIHIKE